MQGMHAYIFSGSSENTRILSIEKLLSDYKINQFDVVSLTSENPSIGVNDVRQFIRTLMLTPKQSPYVGGIIKNAELMTPEAQNALLKTLEEPPPKVILILGVTNEILLLPTIKSRCQIQRLSDDHSDSPKVNESWEKLFNTLFSINIGEKMLFVQSVTTNREESLICIDYLIRNLQAKIYSDILSEGKSKLSFEKISDYVLIIHKLLTAKIQISQNVSASLALDVALF
jgi:hypothetical protein